MNRKSGNRQWPPFHVMELLRRSGNSTMANYCGGCCPSPSSIRIPHSQSQLEGVGYQQLFGSVGDSTELIPFCYLDNSAAKLPSEMKTVFFTAQLHGEASLDSYVAQIVGRAKPSPTRVVLYGFRRMDKISLGKCVVSKPNLAGVKHSRIQPGYTELK